MVYEDETGLLDLPLPKLVGRHQIENAGVAIAGLRHAGCDGKSWTGARTRRWKRACAAWIGRGACSVCIHGPLVADAPDDAEIWLDGGHNPHCAAAVRRAIADLDEKVRPAALSDLRHAQDQGRGGLPLRLQGPGAACGDGGDPGRSRQPGRGRFIDAARQAGLDAAPAEDLEDAMLQVSAWARAHPKEAARAF